MNVSLGSTAKIGGSRNFKVIRGSDPTAPFNPQSLTDVMRHILPNTGNRKVDDYRLRNFRNSTRGLGRIATARFVKAPTIYGVVSAKVFRNCDFDSHGSILHAADEENLGVLSFRVVTDTGVGFLVDAWQNSVELENMKYHAFGTGTTAEAASQTALVTELTTQYATDNTRPTGSLTEGASANIFRSVGTLSPDASVSIAEHALISQAATGGGVMWDRSTFTAIPLVSGDSLQITYDATFTSGG